MAKQSPTLDIAAAVAAYVPTARASTSPAEVRQAMLNLPDPRTITTGRLMFDVGRAVSRWCKGWTKLDRDAIANGAALHLLRWPTQGTSPVLDLGGQRAERMALARVRRHAPTRAAGVLAWVDVAENLAAEMSSVGTLPLRRDWLAEHGGPSRLALRALRAAIKQAADELQRGAAADTEVSTEPLDIAAMIEADKSSEAATYDRLPDVDAPELIARYLDVSLDAARCVIARAFPHVSATDLAAMWGISRQSIANALTRGAAALRERYPDPVTLLEALASVAPQYRTDCERGAIMALIDYRSEYIGADVARAAVSEWRGAVGDLDPTSAALLTAARRAIKRSGGTYGSERAERIACTVPRLLEAERRAAKRTTRVRPTARLDKVARAAQRSDRQHLAPAIAQRIAQDRETLRRMLDAGSGNADAIGALRAGIAHALAA
jgi:hypothetical protein